MDAIQLRFMALVLELLVSILYKTHWVDMPTEMIAANEMIIFLKSRARAVS